MLSTNFDIIDKYTRNAEEEAMKHVKQKQQEQAEKEELEDLELQEQRKQNLKNSVKSNYYAEDATDSSLIDKKKKARSVASSRSSSKPGSNKNGSSKMSTEIGIEVDVDREIEEMDVVKLRQVLKECIKLIKYNDPIGVTRESTDSCIKRWFSVSVGKKKYSDGVYSGELVCDIRNGRGRMEYLDYDEEVKCYDGEWKNGEYNGKGRMELRNGDWYDGEWKNGERSGYGEEYNGLTREKMYGTYERNKKQHMVLRESKSKGRRVLEECTDNRLEGMRLAYDARGGVRFEIWRNNKCKQSKDFKEDLHAAS